MLIFVSGYKDLADWRVSHKDSFVNTAATATIECLTIQPTRVVSTLSEDVVNGLFGEPRSLPPKYFYGSTCGSSRLGTMLALTSYSTMSPSLTDSMTVA